MRAPLLALFLLAALAAPFAAADGANPCDAAAGACSTVLGLYQGLNDNPGDGLGGIVEGLTNAVASGESTAWVVERAAAENGALASAPPPNPSLVVPSAPETLAAPILQPEALTGAGALDPEQALLAMVPADTVPGVAVATPDAALVPSAPAVPEASAASALVVQLSTLQIPNVLPAAPLQVPVTLHRSLSTRLASTVGPLVSTAAGPRAVEASVAPHGDNQLLAPFNDAQPASDTPGASLTAAGVPSASASLAVVAPVVAAAALPALAAVGAALLLLPLYHRLHQRRVLEHDARARIVALVTERPGMHIEEVARAAGLQRSTAVYHLRTLVRHGQLVAMDGAKSVHYYPVGTTRDEASRTRLALLSSPRTRAVAEHVRDHPGLTRAELAAKVGIAASTLSWHLGRLLEAGLVVDDRAPSGHVVARPAEGLAEMLAPWKGAPATAPVESPVPVAALAAPAA